MYRDTKILLLAASLTALGAEAYAAENDAMTVATAKISLGKAVSAAEQHVNGKAARAEFEKSKHGWIYDVEIVSAGKVFDVAVDANTGTITSSHEDTADRDDDDDKQD